MDTERVQAYLKVACAALGFDVGEVWVANRNLGSSTIPDLEEKKFEPGFFENGQRVGKNRNNVRFLQLYTSKSMDKQRCNLLSPPSEVKSSPIPEQPEDDDSSLDKHVLSPRLVDAASSTMKVVWANCEKQDGLLGRSNMCLQTAVGMPVAVDVKGNICVVVMFSRHNVQSNDDAMEYLQFITKSATSHSIPGLLPVVGEGSPESESVALPDQAYSNQRKTSIHPNLNANKHTNLTQNCPTFPEGVTARIVSFKDKNRSKNTLRASESENGTEVEVHTVHDLKAAPKDCFGIPMLPFLAELGGNKDEEGMQQISASDAFDEASYGVWNTIMDNAVDTSNEIRPEEIRSDMNGATTSGGISEQMMPQIRIDRLEEFASAFLDMSLFDIAEVWLPSSYEDFDSFSHVTTVASTSINRDLVHRFRQTSSRTRIKVWSGAIGRAFGSGNPVWSSNKNVIVDPGRSSIFNATNIKTVLAVPVYSAGDVKPACVLSCYAFHRINSVPFVLRFVQQALRMLWEGLDVVTPHSSVDQNVWKGVNPADLGEMAADVEMQKAFLVKKRPREAMSFSSGNKDSKTQNQQTSDLSFSLQSMSMPTSPTLTPTQNILFLQDNNLTLSSVTPHNSTAKSIETPSNEQYWSSMQNLRTIGETVLKTHHRSVPTNSQGTKRAHMVTRCEPNADVNNSFLRGQDSRMVDHYQSNLQESKEQIMSSHDNYPQKPFLISPNLDSNALLHQQPQSFSANPTKLNKLVSMSSNLTAIETPSNAGINKDQQVQNAFINSSGDSNQIQQSINRSKALIEPFRPGPKTNQTLHYPIQGNEKSMILAHVDHSNNEAVRTQQNLVNPSNNSHREDPSVAKRNIAEFNAMAQMATNRISTNNNMQHLVTAPPTVTNGPTLGGPTIFGDLSLNPYCIPVSSNEVSGAKSASKKLCRIQGCNESTASRRPYCLRHSGNRLCEFLNCTKCAQGATRFCIAHGGGRRCTFKGCDKGARDKFFCAAHGGGKRCSQKGCSKSAVGGSNLCTSHGGGKRCCVEGCLKSAQSSTKYCVRHGGGKKCIAEGCDKVARGKTLYCAGHGGGVRCRLEGCNRVAVGKLQLCRTHGGGTRSVSPVRPGKSNVYNNFSQILPLP